MARHLNKQDGGTRRGDRRRAVSARHSAAHAPARWSARRTGPLLGYLQALEIPDRKFPGFVHDIHGVEVVDRRDLPVLLPRFRNRLIYVKAPFRSGTRLCRIQSLASGLRLWDAENKSANLTRS